MTGPEAGSRGGCGALRRTRSLRKPAIVSDSAISADAGDKTAVNVPIVCTAAAANARAGEPCEGRGVNDVVASGHLGGVVHTVSRLALSPTGVAGGAATAGASGLATASGRGGGCLSCAAGCDGPPADFVGRRIHERGVART